METLSKIRARYAKIGVKFDAYGTKQISVHLIVVPRNKQKLGIGSNLMKDLINLADQNQSRIVLCPSDEFGATSKNRLIKFYERFGFVQNKGRNKDFTISETMYRNPLKIS